MVDEEAIEVRPTPVVFVGEGDFPDDLDRVNWGAFGFAAIWALLYGPRRWLGALVAAFFVPVLIDNIAIFVGPIALYRQVRPITSAVMAIALPTIAALYAVVVNRQVWQREHAKFEASPGTLAGVIPLDRYRKSVRFWGRFFVGLLVLGWSVTIAFFLLGRLSAAEAFVPNLYGVAIVALFVHDRVRSARRARITSATT